VAVGVMGAIAGTASAANLAFNGGFENNTAGGTQYNLSNTSFNALMADVTACGAAQEVDIMLGDGGFGPEAVEGKWKIAIHRQSGGATDAIAMALSQPLVAGQSYNLGFFAAAAADFDPNNGPVLVGVSGVSNAFGTQVYSSGGVTFNAFTKYSTTFVAPDNSAFLTFSVDQVSSWIHLDAVELTRFPLRSPRSSSASPA
jgi:hypothetical protein